MAIPRQRVSPQEVRRRFNEGRSWQRAQAGEFTQVVDDECNPGSPAEPPGTRSPMVAYLDATGQRIALVHQYLRPDGTLGGSGRPDPKLLVEGGVAYDV